MNKEHWDRHIAVALKIQRDPDSWNQRSWVSSCGTKYCYFGHAIILAGYKFHIPTDGLQRSDYVYSDTPREEGLVMQVFDAGRILLGLTDDQSYTLSETSMTWPKIVLLLNDWARYDEVVLPAELTLTPAQMRRIADADDDELEKLEQEMLRPESSRDEIEKNEEIARCS